MTLSIWTPIGVKWPLSGADMRHSFASARLSRTTVSLALAFCALSLCTAACSDLTLTSRRLGPEYLPPVAPVAGFSYFLPRGLIPLSVKPIKDGTAIALTLGSTQLYPDHNARYLAEWHESAFSDDNFNLSIDKNGLLSSLNSDVTDRTPDIVKKVIEIATNAAVAGMQSNPPPGAENKTQQPCQIDVLIDPFRSSSSKAANKSLSKCGLAVTLNLPGETDFPTTSAKRDEELLNAASSDDYCRGSICFRPVIPVSIKVSGEMNGTAVDSTFVAVVPDVRSVASYNLYRGACIQRNNTLTFESGVLVKADLKKPSEVLACLEIPLSIAKAFASIPGQLLTVRVTQAESQVRLLQAERNSIIAQQALIQTRLNGQ